MDHESEINNYTIINMVIIYTYVSCTLDHE